MRILYHARVVAFVGGHNRLHDQGPHVVSDLKGTTVKIQPTSLDVLSVSLPGQPLTLKPPILWSFLNSLPFLYQRRLGTGCPTAWQRNFTVLLAGTAWSCFSIFSGMTQRGADAGGPSEWQSRYNYGFKRKRRGRRVQRKEARLRWSFSLLADCSLETLFSSEDDSSSSSSSEDLMASVGWEVRC